MSTANPCDLAQDRLHGLRTIVRFNWPQYARAAGLIAAVAAVVWIFPPPPLAALLLAGGAVLVLFWSVSSLAASHWVYDRSAVADWRFLPGLFDQSEHPLRSGVNIHAGYDDTTARLRVLFPAAHFATVDLYDPRWIREPSIRRARRVRPPQPDLQGRPDRLPLPDGSADAVFLLLAAHELRRRPLQRQLLAESRRVLRPQGRLVLVEHARDLANFVAFGPGCWHFQRCRRWIDAAASAGLTPRAAGRVTPLVRYFVWEK